MPPIQIVAGVAGVYANSEINFVTPADVRDGDTLLVCLHIANAYHAAAKTLASRFVLQGETQGATSWHHLLVATASAEAAIITVPVPDSMTPLPVAALLVLRGASPDRMPTVSSTAYAAATTTVTAPAINLAHLTDLLIAVVSSEVTGSTTTVDVTSMTEVVTAHAGGSGPSITVATQLIEAAGNTGSRLATGSSSNTYHATLFSLAAAVVPLAPTVRAEVPGAIGLPVIGV